MLRLKRSMAEIKGNHCYITMPYNVCVNITVISPPLLETETTVLKTLQSMFPLYVNVTTRQKS